MGDERAHLVDGVLPRVPLRQWGLTVPYRLRYQMAFDHSLSRRCSARSHARDAMGRLTLSSAGMYRQAVVNLQHSHHVHGR
jgi:hypothetical protein